MKRGCFLSRARLFSFPFRNLVFCTTSCFIFGPAQDSLECVLEREGAGRVFSLWFQIANKWFDCSLESKVAWPASELKVACGTLGGTPDGLGACPSPGSCVLAAPCQPARGALWVLPSKALEECRALKPGPKASRSSSLFRTGSYGHI